MTKLIILTLIGFFLLVNFTFAEKTKAPEIQLPVKQIPLDRMAINTLISHYADLYGVESDDMSKVIKCESNFNINAVNMKDSHALSKGSHGIAQFSRETIKAFGKPIGIENADPYNPQQAIEVMAYMFSIGKQGHWSCAKIMGIL